MDQNYMRQIYLSANSLNQTQLNPEMKHADTHCINCIKWTHTTECTADRDEVYTRISSSFHFYCRTSYGLTD
jgi:hypothetical protein